MGHISAVRRVVVVCVVVSLSLLHSTRYIAIDFASV